MTGRESESVFVCFKIIQKFQKKTATFDTSAIKKNEATFPEFCN